jgi:hypothetical protein
MSVSYITSAGNRDFISDFRDLKLRLIKSDINFTINQKALIKYNNELIFISKKFSNDIITGSLALSLFGLINREISDIDILIKDENRFSGYNNHSYGDSETGSIENRLGYILFDFKNTSTNFLKNLFTKNKRYEVDFFKDLNSKYIEFEFNGTILKLQHPLEIINKKMGLSKNHKHYRDLEIIFYHFAN